MYITVRGVPGERAGRRGRWRAPRVVVLLGVVSLLTDLSSEMVVAILPLYLTAGLGLSPLQFGVVDGLYRGVTAAVRIVGGAAADLTRRPKLVATLGYGLSAATKPLLLVASGFAAVSAVVSLDRIGKGIRTAPRDAMIAGATPAASLGTAFGVHRAMDSAGALGGPLLAFVVLAAIPSGFDVVFVVSFGLALLGVAVLVLFVPEQRGAPVGSMAVDGEAVDGEAVDGGAGRPRGAAAVREVLAGVVRLGRSRDYRRVLVVAGLLSVSTVTDSFVYLVLRDRVGIDAEVFPLLFVGTSLAYLALAVPMGRIADRVGRGRVFVAGHVVAVAAYLLLALGPASWVTVTAVLLLLGTYYACTDGVLAALTSTLVPVTARSSGLSGVQTVVALGGLLSAVTFGVVWSRGGPVGAVLLFAAGLAVAVVVAVALLPGMSSEQVEEASA